MFSSRDPPRRLRQESFPSRPALLLPSLWIQSHCQRRGAARETAHGPCWSPGRSPASSACAGREGAQGCQAHLARLRAETRICVMSPLAVLHAVRSQQTLNRGRARLPPGPRRKTRADSWCSTNNHPSSQHAEPSTSRSGQQCSASGLRRQMPSQAVPGPGILLTSSGTAITRLLRPAAPATRPLCSPSTSLPTQARSRERPAPPSTC